jgi:hypothetical protein
MISVSFQDVEGYDKDDIIDETSPSYLFAFFGFSLWTTLMFGNTSMLGSSSRVLYLAF